MIVRPRILLVVGARPNFMKIAPVLRTLEPDGRTTNVLLHSGQHYDHDTSEAFFEDLGIREPDLNLGVGSGRHGAQTAAVLAGVEEVLIEGRWDFVVVVGDVNSTLAAALAAVKLGIPVAHVEAGLRSGDRGMPEEINRILTDQLSSVCLTPSRDADENLLAEGIGRERIAFVGNVMIDSLLLTIESARDIPLPEPRLEPGRYVLATLHRPSNVDDPDQLRAILTALERISTELPVFLPVHPRTAKAIEVAEIEVAPSVVMSGPVGYREILRLQADAAVVLTDSGGMQEETTVLGVPCLTLRSSTERPITITEGTNRLVPDRTTEAILEAFGEVYGVEVKASRPEGWDGLAGERVRDRLHQALGIL